MQTFGSIYFRGKRHFVEDATQNYIVFQSMCRYFMQVLVVVIVFIFGSLKDCPMKKLRLLLQLIIALIQSYVILVLKQE